MPKEKSEEPKKKVVVVEEIEETPVEIKEETPKAEETKTPEVKDVETVETKKEVSASEVIEPQDDYDRPNYLWIIVPTALLVGALVGGLITYFSGLSGLVNTETPIPSPTVTAMPEVKETPEASPVSSLKKDTLKIQILNGSGVSGAASKAKTLLEGLGYKTIETGNAASSDFESTEVAYTATKKEYLDVVIKDLSKSYEAVESKKVLPTTSKYDIVITLGKK